jgi:hypothetical protein
VYKDHKDKNVYVIFPKEYMEIIKMATVDVFEAIPDILT